MLRLAAREGFTSCDTSGNSYSELVYEYADALWKQWLTAESEQALLHPLGGDNEGGEVLVGPDSDPAVTAAGLAPGWPASAAPELGTGVLERLMRELNARTDIGGSRWSVPGLRGLLTVLTARLLDHPAWKEMKKATHRPHHPIPPAEIQRLTMLPSLRRPVPHLCRVPCYPLLTIRPDVSAGCTAGGAGSSLQPVVVEGAFGAQAVTPRMGAEVRAGVGSKPFGKGQPCVGADGIRRR